MSDLPELEYAQRIEGSLAVVPHPVDPVTLGRGDVEVEGTLKLNEIHSNKNDVILVYNPLDFTLTPSSSQLAVEHGSLRIYADADTGKVASMDVSGIPFILNPTTTPGDISVYGINGPERLPIGQLGQALVVGPSNQLTWTNVATTTTKTDIFGSNAYNIAADDEIIGTNTDFITVLSLSAPQMQGTCAFCVSFQWCTSDAMVPFHITIAENGNEMISTTDTLHDVDSYNQFSWNTILQQGDTPISSTFELRVKVNDKTAAYKIRCAYMETYRMA